ncbi:hypothetical protein ACFQWH_05820 [Mycolicibacterium sp. GCM10028919]|uniref:hypothetical protein n=1 Tax=Mycolicibacterium sp. GCM10028919 TaxID=3273401 RepID=UPI0036177F60
MTFWKWVTRRRTDRGWPGYIINGRIRTSTAALVVSYFLVLWLYNTYQPEPPAPPAAPETAIVPPGFVPDPEYTWVPRTNVQERPRTTTPRTTTTTTPTPTTTTPTTTTSPTTPTSPTTTGPPAPSTVVDPDGPGPLPPTTVVQTTEPGLPFQLPTLPGPAPSPTPPPQ